MRKRLFLLSTVFLLLNCTDVHEKSLYEGFLNPPPTAKPFVRWWWNGNHLDESEITRQLDILEEAGIGGIEINSIEMPDEAKDVGTKPIQWLSKEWNQMLKFAAQEAQKRDMIVDLIVGSGWPFGGEFLEEDETIQRVIIHKIPCSGGDQIREDKESLYRQAMSSLNPRSIVEPAKSYELFFVRLVPDGSASVSGIVDYTDEVKKNGVLDLVVPGGNYQLVYGMLQRSHRIVMHGAPGAAGPVMNHYEKEITLSYLNRLKKIAEDTGIPLDELIRALFCDSIELAGANWTDDFEELFFNAYKYRLEPYFPFIFYEPYDGYDSVSDFSPGFQDEIRRVRHDYNQLLVNVFLDNFTQVFQEFCTENGLLCRYQAYGTPFLMGMLEGNMIPDIPESNNWLYSAEMDNEEWRWNQEHGYMTWNLYAASGGHLTGRKIISCESMTNNNGPFKTSLSEIKQHDDMNFITGINHTILHGFNYSPREAGFPGWIRFGSYFSNQNTWWRWFPKWVDYNARLSYVFQQAQPVKNIAVLAPVGDIWSDYGLSREPFHMKPWYCYRLWEPLSQAGSSCDYISEKIIREGSKENGRLNFGPMSYEAVFLCSVQSLEPETAKALTEFVETGGRLVFIDSIPDRSLAYQDASVNDSLVKDAIQQLIIDHSEQVFLTDNPGSETNLLSWAIDLLKKIQIEKDVEINHPDKNVFQIRKKRDGKEIYFFTNSNRVQSVSFRAKFPNENKIPWRWDPEDGTRSVYPFEKNGNELEIDLMPLQSLLLVFEPDSDAEPVQDKKLSLPGKKVATVTGPWDVRFEHANGEKFSRILEELIDLGSSTDPGLNAFAGEITYATTFHSDGEGDWIDLGEVNKGVTEVFINGKPLGVNWYGKPVFPLHENRMKKGDNRLEIRYTSVLSNYVMSLENNPTAKRWTRGYEKIPLGLTGDISILTDKE